MCACVCDSVGLIAMLKTAVHAVNVVLMPHALESCHFLCYKYITLIDYMKQFNFRIKKKKHT